MIKILDKIFSPKKTNKSKGFEGAQKSQISDIIRFSVSRNPKDFLVKEFRRNFS